MLTKTLPGGHWLYSATLLKNYTARILPGYLIIYTVHGYIQVLLYTINTEELVLIFRILVCPHLGTS